MEGSRHSLGSANHAASHAIWRHADENALICVPRFDGAFCGARRAHLRLDALGGVSKGKLPQGEQVPLLEEALQCLLDLFGNIDLALVKSSDQFVGRDVDEFDFVRFVDNGIRDRLGDSDTRDLGDHVVQAFQVLDVDGGPNVDARLEQFPNILPTLGVPASQRVRVGKFINEDRCGFAGKRCIKIKLSDACADHLARRNALQPFCHRFGFSAPVRFQITDHKIAVTFLLLLRRLKHGVGFADACRHAEKDLETAFLMLSHLRQQRIRIGASSLGHLA